MDWYDGVRVHVPVFWDQRPSGLFIADERRYKLLQVDFYARGVEGEKHAGIFVLCLLPRPHLNRACRVGLELLFQSKKGRLRVVT